MRHRFNLRWDAIYPLLCKIIGKKYGCCDSLKNCEKCLKRNGWCVVKENERIHSNSDGIRRRRMSQIILAPSKEEPKYPTVFLAGGITNCRDWQDKVAEELKDVPITVFNPRRETFDITDKNASYNQIKWEYERLEKMDFFSMYFCGGESVQPICMYELGRNIVRMQNRFPNDWQDRIIVSVENGYKRKDDVIIQLGLCAPKINVYSDITPSDHAAAIKHQFKRITVHQ